MKIRGDLLLNGGQRKLYMASDGEETFEHMALKLSAYLLFWDYEPVIAPSIQNPPLAGQEFRPDLMGLDVAGDIALWVECGNTALHKMNKLTRRYPSARLVVVKASERDGRKMRADVEDQLDRHEKVEILAWPAGPFKAWLGAVAETVHVVGEARDRSLNLVINETPIVADLIPF